MGRWGRGGERRGEKERGKGGIEGEVQEGREEA